MSSFGESDITSNWLKSLGFLDSTRHISTDDGAEISLFSHLNDGTVLCHLINLLKPGTIQKVNDLNLFKFAWSETFFNRCVFWNYS